jgi:hypothetical protein
LEGLLLQISENLALQRIEAAELKSVLAAPWWRALAASENGRPPALHLFAPPGARTPVLQVVRGNRALEATALVK